MLYRCLLGCHHCLAPQHLGCACSKTGGLLVALLVAGKSNDARIFPQGCSAASDGVLICCLGVAPGSVGPLCKWCQAALLVKQAKSIRVRLVYSTVGICMWAAGVVPGCWPTYKAVASPGYACWQCLAH